MGRILSAALLASVAAPAMAEECASYVGTTVSTMSFDSVAGKLKTMPATKGEYETTAAFEARVAAARGGMPAKVIVGSKLDPKYLTYDADTGTLRVQAYALRNINTNYSDVFGYGTPYYEKVKYGSNNRDWVVSQSETATGSYRGSNAFGVTVTVTKLLRIDRTIFESEADGFSEYLWPDQDREAFLQPISMSPEAARALKATGRAAVVIAPKWPYYAEGTRHWEPNIDSRTDVTNPIKVIVADIQCGLVLDNASKVVAAYRTR